MWAVMNGLESAKKNGEPATLKLGLYSHGNALHEDGVEEIVLISNLTTDLDTFSQDFFELTANGSQEFVGTVVDRAVDQLHWNQEGDFKALFVAGNETIHQGTIKAQTAAEKAVAQGIIVTLLKSEKKWA